ncbi:MAG: ATP-dependent Clp protease ATP-binding subunit ClpC, partial [Actinomycetota bacterium]|nr:ATP-dependent Clp protease ATP-binding subunit ClpC [Actinomycetota bacterium]
CQAALERAVRGVTALRTADGPTVAAGAVSSGPFARFTPRARHAVVLAEQAAKDTPHNYIGTEHLLLGTLDEGGNLALKVLSSLDIEIDDLRAELVASLGPPTEPGGDNLPFTPLLRSSLELAGREALGLGHNYIGCEHLLLGLLATEDGLASKVLRRMGVEMRAAKRAVVAALTGFVHAREVLGATNDTAAVLAEISRRLDALEQRLTG